MAEEIDYSTWTTEELVAEIGREEEVLKEHQRGLAEARGRLAEIEEALKKEREPDRDKRIKTRQEAIRRLEERIAGRQETIDRLLDRIRFWTEQAHRVDISPVARAVIRGTIRSISRSIGGYRGWQTRDLRSLRSYKGWITRERPYTTRLRELQEAHRYYEREIASLEAQIETEQARLQKKREALPKLYRVKIRLYAVKKRKNYYLTFQGFFDIDAILDPETGWPVWDWWLTEEEIRMAKFHFHGYWTPKEGLIPVFSQDEIERAYLTDVTGVARSKDLEELAKIRYTKRVPEEYLRVAKTMTLRDVIVGISNIKPRPTKEPEGVFCQYMMIVDDQGYIKWMDRRNKFVWKPTRAMIDRVKEELGL